MIRLGTSTDGLQAGDYELHESNKRAGKKLGAYVKETGAHVHGGTVTIGQAKFEELVKEAVLEVRAEKDLEEAKWLAGSYRHRIEVMRYRTENPEVQCEPESQEDTGCPCTPTTREDLNCRIVPMRAPCKNLWGEVKGVLRTGAGLTMEWRMGGGDPELLRSAKPDTLMEWRMGDEAPVPLRSAKLVPTEKEVEVFVREICEGVKKRVDEQFVGAAEHDKYEFEKRKSKFWNKYEKQFKMSK